jgi:hypothetical protein
LRLGALLLNPTPAGGITRQRLDTAREILQMSDVMVGNLLEVETRGAVELTRRTLTPSDWATGRRGLARAIWTADALMVGWGVGTLSGGQRRAHVEQMKFALHEATRAGHIGYWTMSHKTRHPSRWHRRNAVLDGYSPDEPIEARISRSLRFKLIKGDNYGSS